MRVGWAWPGQGPDRVGMARAGSRQSGHDPGRVRARRGQGGLDAGRVGMVLARMRAGCGQGGHGPGRALAGRLRSAGKRRLIVLSAGSTAASRGARSAGC